MWCTISINVLFVERACQKYILMFYDLYNERNRETGCTFSTNVLVDEKKTSIHQSIFHYHERKRETGYTFIINVLIDERERLLFLKIYFFISRVKEKYFSFLP